MENNEVFLPIEIVEAEGETLESELIIYYCITQ